MASKRSGLSPWDALPWLRKVVGPDNVPRSQRVFEARASRLMSQAQRDDLLLRHCESPGLGADCEPLWRLKATAAVKVRA